jgi:hypothetical protein
MDNFFAGAKFAGTKSSHLSTGEEIVHPFV